MQGWLRIRGTMAAYMITVRNHRIRREEVAIDRNRRTLIVDIWSERMMLQKDDEFVPSQVDLWETPDLNRLLLAPTNVDVTASDVRVALHRIDPHLVNWRTGHLNRLFEKFAQFLPSGSSIASLRLAVCVASCTDPNALHGVGTARRALQMSPTMWYPEFLHHMCNTHVMIQPLDPSHTDEVEEGYMRMRRLNNIPGCYRAAWTSEGLIFNVKASLVVYRLLECFGLDPTVTSVSDLDLLGSRVYCMTCRENLGGEGDVEVYSWRQAVSYILLPSYRSY